MRFREPGVFHTLWSAWVRACNSCQVPGYRRRETEAQSVARSILRWSEDSDAIKVFRTRVLELHFSQDWSLKVSMKSRRAKRDALLVSRPEEKFCLPLCQLLLFVFCSSSSSTAKGFPKKLTIYLFLFLPVFQAITIQTSLSLLF